MQQGFNRHSRAGASVFLAAALFISAVFSPPFVTQVIAARTAFRTSQDSVEKSASDFRVTFVDVAARAGLTEPISYGGVDKKRYIIETNGCGVAFMDYDADGWVD